MKKLISLNSVLNNDNSTFVSVSYVDAENILQTQELTSKEVSDLLKALTTILPDFTIVK